MKEKVAIISVLVNFILAVGKTLVGLFTGAASVLAEGIHSSMDVISSGVSLMGIKISKKPVDKKHPYGHYKFEVLSGLFITVLLLGTGIWIIYKAYKGFLNPETVSLSYLAIGVMIISAVLNEATARWKIHVGKKENSLSLLSDGVHDRVDVWTSLAVLIGLFIMPYWIYVDSILAFLIGIYILKESIELGKEATDSLLDVSAGEEVENKIKEIIKKHNFEIADIKTQKKGSAVTANLEIRMPKEFSVDKAEKVTKKLKEELVNDIQVLEYVAIQIAGSDVSSSYYKPSGIERGFGKGFGWQGKGRFKSSDVKEIAEKAQGKGPSGYCICPNPDCNYKVKHQRGTPCATIKCPKCGTKMTRE